VVQKTAKRKGYKECFVVELSGEWLKGLL
jgi:hypothetical protein